MKNNNKIKAPISFFGKFMAGFCLSLLCFILVPVCFADTASENAALARIIHILDSLNPMINAAELQADSTARIKFHYDWLRQDLDAIRTGLAQKINLPQIEPRVVTPLKGDFIQMEDKSL